MVREIILDRNDRTGPYRSNLRNKHAIRIARAGNGYSEDQSHARIIRFPHKCNSGPIVEISDYQAIKKINEVAEIFALALLSDPQQ
jgi:hypothetical protein